MYRGIDVAEPTFGVALEENFEISSFDIGQAIGAAKSGKLRGAELRKTIKRASDLGLTKAVQVLESYLVHTDVFVGDPAPLEIKQLFAEGTSLLKSMGCVAYEK